MSLNPYEPPQVSSRPAALEIYYQMDFRRLRFKELWQQSETILQFLVAAMAKAIHLRIPYPFAESLQILTITAEELDGAAAAAFVIPAKKVMALGFRYVWTGVRRSIGPYYSAGSVFISKDDRSLFCLYFLRAIGHEQVQWSIDTRLDDGRVLTTSPFRNLDRIIVWELREVLPHGSIEEVQQRHENRLAEYEMQIVPFQSPDDITRFLLASNDRLYSELIARGIHVPLTDREYHEILRKHPPERNPAHEPHSDNGGSVLQALSRMTVVLLAAAVLYLYYQLILVVPFPQQVIGTLFLLGGSLYLSYIMASYLYRHW